MKNSFDKLKKIAEEIFPESTFEGHLLKAKDEIDEVIENPSDVSEFADVLICVFNAAHKRGISYEQLYEAVENKIPIIEKRVWTKTEDGNYQHVEDNDN